MSVTQQEQKFVAFRISNEYYCIDVHQVTEVFVPSSITAIPQAATFVAGVINFRGVIVTVIDLRIRLGIGQTESTTPIAEDEDRIYVIIVKSGDNSIGLLVDYVESVLTIDRSLIQSSLDLISGSQKTNFITGIARTDLGLTIMLSVNAVLADFDPGEVRKLAEIRKDLLGKDTDDDEIVVSSASIVDLDQDDLSSADRVEVGDPAFKKVDVEKYDDSVGASPLDLQSLTKAELLKIAVEMEIADVSNKTNKKTLVEKIMKIMGG